MRQWRPAAAREHLEADQVQVDGMVDVRDQSPYFDIGAGLGIGLVPAFARRGSTRVTAASRDHRLGREWSGRDGARACSLLVPVTPPEEVSPMNAVSMWVLPLPVTAGRLT